MSPGKDDTNTLILAERRRKIYNWALQKGSVNVKWLAKTLGVGLNTIRNDLDALEREGKLVRSHGGAVIGDSLPVRVPYLQTRDRNMAQKAAIGEAACRSLPETGSVYVGAGSTVYEMTIRFPRTSRLHVVTVSPLIASHLVSNTLCTVDILGGRIRQDSSETDVSLSQQALDMMFWDVAYMGVTALDLEHGVTTIERSIALYEQKIIEHASKVVVLCDSSKIGRISYASVCPASSIDILVTDNLISEEVKEAFVDQGVEVCTVEVEQLPPDLPKESR